MMPFRRVVVGVDFTDTSLAAARWASVELAPEAEIVLAHIAPEPAPPQFLRGHLPPVAEIVTEKETALYRGLCGLADLVGRERASVQMLSGQPADGLAAIARRLGADAVCVGKSVKRRGGARFGATTASRLLARTDLPVVVVPAGSRGAPSLVLAAVSDFAHDDAVLRDAGRLAATWGASLEALHVMEPSVRERARELVGALDAAHVPLPAGIMDDSRLHALAEAWLASLLPHARLPRGAATSLVRHGDPGQEIIAHARHFAIDMIVVGRGALASGASSTTEGTGAGSTARLVLWAAECPVLVLGRSPIHLAPTIVALESDARARPAPLVVARGGRRAVLAHPRPPRRPGPGGGDAA
jgi:nucleotide-binding universal stress UspA family protein